MNNTERIEFIDAMIEQLDSEKNLYLCYAYSDVFIMKRHLIPSLVMKSKIAKEFPAIKFFARLCGGNPKAIAWWNMPANCDHRMIVEPRIRTLKLLRWWYRVKCYIFMIN